MQMILVTWSDATLVTRPGKAYLVNPSVNIPCATRPRLTSSPILQQISTFAPSHFL